jgi:hypothetical protein
VTTETHTCCNARLAKEGGKARCCYCVPHEGCELDMSQGGTITPIFETGKGFLIVDVSPPDKVISIEFGDQKWTKPGMPL